MTIRYYITNHAPAFQPTLKGAWDTTAAVVYRELGARDGPINTVSQAETSTNTQWDMALLVLVLKIPFSGTLVNTSGALVYDIRVGRLASTVSSFVAHNHSWISVGATNTVRHTGVVDGIGGANWLTTGEFRFANASWNTTSAVTAGDHLVLELGARGITSSSTSRTATMYYSGLGAPDPVDTTAVTNQAGWVDFSRELEDLILPLPISGTPLLMAA